MFLVAASSAAYGAGQAKVLHPVCVVSGDTCTVRMAMSAADNNVSVSITTPRKNHGAVITDNNHTPFNAMYNVDETSTGISFELQGTSGLAPGTVLIIVFKLLPAGSPAASAAPAAPASASSGTGELSLSGPSSNKLGSSFVYTLSAHPAVAALLLAFEIPGSSCAAVASAYSRSSARVHQSVPASAFRVTFHFTAEPAGAYALCLYLVNPATSATEAHASAHWTNAA